jgi:phosphate-selective porin OprO/OprP
MQRHRSRIGLTGCASLIALAWVSPLHAQAAIDPAATRDARIEAIQAQLNTLQAELVALRREGGAPPVAASAQAATRSAPGSAATAGLGQSATVAETGAADRPRIFGSGIPTTAAVSRIDAGHPVIATSDGRFTASLLGVMQFDVADYFQHAAGPLTTDFRRAGSASNLTRALQLSDGTTFRRARIGIGGRAFGDFEYSVLFDFGGAGEEASGHVQELWLQYSGLRPAHIRVGAFAPFIGLEDAGSTNGMMFLERPDVSDVARGLAGGEYREGAQIAFTGDRWFASAAVTGRLVNTAGSTTVQPYRSPLGLIGRAGLLPIKTDDDLVHVGVHGSYVAHPANTAGPDAAAGTLISPVDLSNLPELTIDSTRLIDTGAIDALHVYSAGVEFAAQHRNFEVQGEYERIGINRRASTLANPRFNGFYVEGSWLITGQHRRYNNGNYAFDGPEIIGSFDPKSGNYGAWELALRYSDIDLNYDQGDVGTALPTGGVRGGNQKIATAGVNWYLNSISRVMFDYQLVTIDRLSPNATSYQTPVGAQIGQSYSTGSVRFQLAF